MAYQALYRQWRPSTFSEMVGQEGIITALRNQVEMGRIAHAYLFCGTRGTGKTSTAKILARAVNCEDRQHGDPCGVCESCKRILAGESLDIMEIDAASNNGVDQVRELRDTVQYPPQYGKYKVYIIDEVHMLSTAAFNALLKTLEEPPEYVIFILATTEPQKLPATILSRCQRFDFGRIPAEKIAGRLKEAAEGAGVTVSQDALQLIARAAEGGMRDALSILDMCMGYQEHVDANLVHQVLGTADRGFLFRFGQALKDANIPAALGLIDEMMRAGRDPLVFSRDLSEHIRALLLAANCGEALAEILEITQEDAGDYLKQAENFAVPRLLRMMDIYMGVESSMRTIALPRLALESATIRACLSDEAQDVEALVGRIAELEGQLKDVYQKIQDGIVVQEKPKTQTRNETATASRKAPVAEKVATDDEQAVWKAVINFLKKSEGVGLSANSFLAGGTFKGKIDDHYVWEAKEGSNGVVNMLNMDKYRNAIQEAMKEVTGQELRFKAVKSGELKTLEEPAEVDDFLAQLNATFDPANVMVQESAKV